MPANLYESNLIQRCCDGDRTAYRELYDYTAGELLAIAIRYMRSKQEAEDVLQEAYIKIFKNLASFNRQASVKTWMIRIVINTSLNTLRKDQHVSSWDLSIVEDKEFNELPLDQFEYSELLGFIHQLPVGCKSVFNLYAIEGYNHKEIAGMLEISEGTSKSQYHRAKMLLQEMIISSEEKLKTKVI
ncbi:MAG: RNA polymerase sigma factor [Bacteroidota bacterium]